MWKRTKRALSSILVIVGLLFTVITVTPLDEWWANLLSGNWAQPAGDALVILAGSGGTANVIGYGTYLRVQYGLMAQNLHPFRRIVVSGGGSPVPQADLMKRFLVCQGIAPELVIAETRSTSTRENALFTKEMLGPQPGKVVLLTSDYHMYRAVRVFRKVGLDVTPSPFPDVMKRAERWSERVPAFVELLKETGKIGYYKWKGWI